MKKIPLVPAAVLAGLFFAVPAGPAKDPAPPPAAPIEASSQAAVEPAAPAETRLSKYLRRCGEKLDLGMHNFLMGWTTVIAEPVRLYRKEPSSKRTAGGFLRAAGKGVLLFPVDTAGGVLNAVTFFVPAKIPLPENGVDLKLMSGE